MKKSLFLQSKCFLRIAKSRLLWKDSPQRFLSVSKCQNTSVSRIRNEKCDLSAESAAAAVTRDVPFLDADVLLNTERQLHIPVMAEQSIKHLDPSNEKCFVDMTFGAGGHTKKILEKAPGAKIFALDRDPAAFNLATTLSKKHSNVVPLNGKFSELAELLDSHEIKMNSIDGILFDIGSSSMQFDSSTRGFAISRNAPLDMRMDGDRLPGQPTAADVINYCSEPDLFHILRKYGEEKHARDIARMIVESRQSFGKIASTKQLADIVELVYQGNHKKDLLGRHSHVATKTFQALRIFVNNELNELNNGLKLAHRYLRPGGACVVISFHSLEDRIAKRHFHGIDMETRFNRGFSDHHLHNSAFTFNDDDMHDLMRQKCWSPVSRKVISATPEEILSNPRSRSAKLRAAHKLTSNKN